MIYGVNIMVPDDHLGKLITIKELTLKEKIKIADTYEISKDFSYDIDSFTKFYSISGYIQILKISSNRDTDEILNNIECTYYNNIIYDSSEEIILNELYITEPTIVFEKNKYVYFCTKTFSSTISEEDLSSDGIYQLHISELFEKLLATHSM